MTTPRSPRGAKRSRLDRKASAKEASAKGSTGDSAVKGLLEAKGWAQVADLARTYPGADLVAVCACKEKHLLWAEVKTYRMGKIEPDSWQHLQDRAEEVTARPRERFALFTYQRKPGGRHQRPEWWAAEWGAWHGGVTSHQPFIGSTIDFRPSCSTPLPMADGSSVPASPIAESGAVGMIASTVSTAAPPAKQPGVL